MAIENQENQTENFHSFPQTKIYLTSQQLELALIELEQTLLQQPNNAIVYLHRANLYYLHNRWAEALLNYDRAISLDRDNPIPRIDRGLFHLKRNQFQLAAQPKRSRHSTQTPLLKSLLLSCFIIPETFSLAIRLKRSQLCP